MNNYLVSVPQGSEDFSFKSKNIHEEALFKVIILYLYGQCEDDRYHLDHAMKNIQSTIDSLNLAWKEIEVLSEEEKDKYTLNPD